MRPRHSPLSKKEIAQWAKWKKELLKFGIIEEYTEVKISETYLKDFLKFFDPAKLGKRDYLAEPQILAMFKRIQAKHPEMTQKQLAQTVHRLIPFVRVLFARDKLLDILKEAIHADRKKL